MKRLHNTDTKSVICLRHTIPSDSIFSSNTTPNPGLVKGFPYKHESFEEYL